MTKYFGSDLVLEEDAVFEESVEVSGSILGKNGLRFNLTVNGNINAGDINARNIDAWDINAGDINAGDIDAWEINYYTVCFAYKNIKCNTIKGRRSKSKHFCLDGKITTNKQAGEK